MLTEPTLVPRNKRRPGCWQEKRLSPLIPVLLERDRHALRAATSAVRTRRRQPSSIGSHKSAGMGYVLGVSSFRNPLLSCPRHLRFTIDMLVPAVDTKFRAGQRNGTTVPPLSALPCYASVPVFIARSIPTDRTRPFGLSNRMPAKVLSGRGEYL